MRARGTPQSRKDPLPKPTFTDTNRLSNGPKHEFADVQPWKETPFTLMGNRLTRRRQAAWVAPALSCEGGHRRSVVVEDGLARDLEASSRLGQLAQQLVALLGTVLQRLQKNGSNVMV